MSDRKLLIEQAYENRDLLKQEPYRTAVLETLEDLNHGLIRVAEYIHETNDWLVHQWIQQAILLYFAVSEIKMMEIGPYEFYDKIPLKKNIKNSGFRIVPTGTVRYGCFIEPGAVIMPSFVNIGAYVGKYSMVDTWATVGSCAQIGESVHLAGGVGIGGVLEPPGARPVIIEDNCFIGSRAVIVEGSIVKKESVIAANVVLTASTHIIDVTGHEEKVYKGYVPERSVVIPGSRAKEFPSGVYQIPCALIIGKRKESTDKKTSLNQALRDFSVAV